MTVKRIKAALVRKIGPLPAWGWALIAFAGVYYWRHRNVAASQTATGTAAGVAAGAGYGYGDGSGGGGGGQDQQPLTQAPTDGTFAPVSWDPTQSDPAADPNAAMTAPATITSGPAPATISSRDGGGSKPQPFGGQRAATASAGGAPALAWGGLVFTTQAQFQTWAKLHGTTVRAELGKHPAAAKIYAALQPAPAAPAATRTKAQTRTRTSTAAPPPAPAARPVSVRGIPAPRRIAQPAAATKKKTATRSRSMPATKAAAAFAPPSPIRGIVPNPVTNPIRNAAPSVDPAATRRLAVEAPAIAPNAGYAMLNPAPAAPPPTSSRTTAQAAPVLPTVAAETTRIAPRAGRAIAV